MSITFGCVHCGKSFTVDDKFGGKQGRCKQCNALMSTPMPVGVNVFVPASAAGPSRPSQTMSRPAEPFRGSEIEPTPVRKSKQLYDSLYRKEICGNRRSRPDDSAAAAVGKVAVGIVGSKFASRRELNRLHQGRTDDMNNLADIQARVQDIPSSQRESARAEAAVRKLTAGLIELDKTRGLKADVDAVSRLHAITEINAADRASQEVTRVQGLEGVWLALNIQGAWDEGAAVEDRIIPNDRQLDFNPGFQAASFNGEPGRFNFRARPNFNPTPFVPPNFVPPQPPNFGPNGPRGGFPTMPPRFNNRRGGRPQAGPPN